MIARLDDLGAPDIAREAGQILDEIERLDAKIDTMSDVFRAVEWIDSCDWRESDAPEAFAEHRARRAEPWPCPNPDDLEGCYCPGDGPCVAPASTGT